MEQKKKLIILALIIIVGALFRFYKLDWGQGLFTHPDEYHLVISANQLSFPTQMNPHFFSYGTVSIYLMYFTHQLLPNLNLFLVGRFYSALFSTLTILMVFKIAQLFFPTRYALLAAFLVAVTPGLIQQAHFATPESNLTFFLLTSLFFLLKYTKQSNLRDLVLGSLFFGLALGTKVSSLVFALVFPLAIIIVHRANLFKMIQRLALASLITLFTLILTSPFIFLDFPAFKNNLDYEGGLAAGKFVVFYTRQFINTIPVLFQLEKILPFALGPSLMIFGLFGFLIMMSNILRSKKHTHYLLLVTAFLSIFLSNAFLFAKWTRFLAPTFPFFAIFATYLLFWLNQFKLPRSLFYILYSTFIVLVILWSVAFFSIYTNNDVRITAAKWLTKNTPASSKFLVESGNMIDVPLHTANKMSLDFYGLDQDPNSLNNILTALEQADYFLIESRRVFLNHQRLPNLYPKTAKFYNALFEGSLGFTQIHEVTSFPQLSIFGIEFPDENAEETWSVFDHPVIRIFKKNATLTRQDYVKALAN